jgi:hypothetical protein
MSIMSDRRTVERFLKIAWTSRAVARLSSGEGGQYEDADEAILSVSG